MKRLFCYVGLILLLLTGCSKKKSMDSIINEPNFTGIITEVNENSLLVHVNEGEEERTSSDIMSVSLDTEIKNNITFQVGDEVRIYYDGSIAESYPAQINTVYAVVLADSEQ